MKSQDQQNTLSPKKGENSAPCAPGESNSPRLLIGICVALAIIVWIVFGQTSHFSFVAYDDNLYVYENPTVMQGLTPEGAALAFNYGVNDNWVPLTTLSHMLDCEFYGLDAGEHHLTSVLLHATTTILLFLVLYKMTGAMWRSAFVAAIFAIHPLHVESVTWVSERKDVLCGVFFMLTLWAYLGYVRDPQSLPRYLLTLFLAALGLMSKPILMTLPFILLLLDYWPLKRWGAQSKVQSPQSASGTSVRRLIIEKVPFLVLSLATFIPTVLAERKGIEIAEKVPFALRIENAVVAYAAYIWQLFYPARLAAVYPFPKRGLPLVEIVGALAFLILVSLAVFHWRRKRPYLLTGWLWYLIMLVPVIGVVLGAPQARADHHTYLSQIGLYILLTWLAADLAIRLRHRFLVLVSLSSVILAALIYCARAQTSYWKDSETLWTHNLACTPANSWVSMGLGNVYLADGRLDDAISRYQEALKLEPDDPHFQSNLAATIWLLAKSSRANGTNVLELAKNANQMAGGNSPMTLRALAAAYARCGHFPEAVETGKRALALAAKSQPPAFIDTLKTEITLYQADSPLPIGDTDQQ